MTKPKIILVATVAIAGVAAALLVQLQKQSKLQEKREALEKQDGQLAEVAAENLRLSNAAVQVDHASTNSPSQELQALRNRAETLRQRTNELARQQRPTRTLLAANASAADAPKSEEYYTQLRKAAGTSPMTGRDLGMAIRMYSDSNGDRLPTNMSQLTPFLSGAKISPEAASKFEIVFQGSLDDLKDVPPDAVVLVREREPWPAPDGKMGRVYGMADGSSQMITSDDNFRDWESRHIIKPPSTQLRK